MKSIKKWVGFALLALIVFAPLSAKGSKDSTSTVRKIYSAHTQSNVPYGFVNEKGESDGFEIAVLRAVDELLPEYEFVFVPTSDEDLLIGVETGKYTLGTKGIWMTEERKQKFLFPNNPIAASIIGITFRASDKDTITNIESFARYSGKLVPISPQSAQFALVKEFNDKHPDTPIKLVPSDVFIINDAYAWVLEGRYDGFFDLQLAFQKSVVNSKGAFHSLEGKLAYIPYKGVLTWPLFNKNEKDLAAAYDKAIVSLREKGVLSELSIKYFGQDVFQFVDK